MNPRKVVRSRVKCLTDLPNVGSAGAEDLRRIGIFEPTQLAGKNPLALYKALCEETATRHDSCVIDIFISVTRFMDGDEPRPWWDFTNERKRLLGAK